MTTFDGTREEVIDQVLEWAGVNEVWREYDLEDHVDAIFDVLDVPGSDYETEVINDDKPGLTDVGMTYIVYHDDAVRAAIRENILKALKAAGVEHEVEFRDYDPERRMREWKEGVRTLMLVMKDRRDSEQRRRIAMTLEQYFPDGVENLSPQGIQVLDGLLTQMSDAVGGDDKLTAANIEGVMNLYLTMWDEEFVALRPR